MRIPATLSFLLLSNVTACQTAEPAAADVGGPTAAAAAQREVARIVFIDKEEACDCTRRQIEATWTAMQGALGASAAVPVERLHLDTQSAQAEVFTRLKPLMVPPGVYFLDASGAVIDMLQGEVTQEQVLAMLRGR